MKTWPLQDNEQLMIVKKPSNGQVATWREGLQVFAEDSGDGTSIIRPANQLGPTCVGFPNKLLRKPICEFVDHICGANRPPKK